MIKKMNEGRKKINELWEGIRSNIDFNKIFKVMRSAYDEKVHEVTIESGETFLKLCDKGVVSEEQIDEVIFLLSVSYYYVGNLKRGLDFSDYVYLKNGGYSRAALQNLKYYIQKIDGEKIKIEVDKPKLGNGEEWNLMNPSIMKVKFDDQKEIKYIINCRIVNYGEENGIYFSRESDGIVRTRNFLLFVDKDFKKIKQNEMIAEYKKEREHNVTGLEDVRCVLVDKNVYFTTATYDNHRYAKPKISIGKYGIDDVRYIKSDEEFYVRDIRVIEGKDINRCEKNWLPFVREGELNVIYGFSPFTVYKIRDEDTKVERPEIYYENENKKYEGFRGGCGPIVYVYKNRRGY
jgi:hypothetical protein